MRFGVSRDYYLTATDWEAATTGTAIQIGTAQQQCQQQGSSHLVALAWRQRFVWESRVFAAISREIRGNFITSDRD